MSDVQIGRDIIIDNAELMLEIIEKESGFKDIDTQDIVEFVQSEKSTKFFFDDKMNGRDENADDIVYLWIDTGFEDKAGQALFVSLLDHKGYYRGHFVGNSEYLSSRIYYFYKDNKRVVIANEQKFREKYKRKIEARTTKHLTDRYKSIRANNANPRSKETTETPLGRQLREKGIMASDYDEVKAPVVDPRSVRKYWESEPSELVQDIESMLYINNWKSIQGLDRYIKIIGARIGQLISQKKTEYYVLNNIQSAIVNTGLLNKFGSDIYVIYRKHITYNLYVPHKIVYSKKVYLEEGFTKDKSGVVDLKPISFFNDDDLLFCPTLDDFDITPKALFHIIEERKDRFPNNIRDMSEQMIAQKINNALELGLKLQQRDNSFAKPSYSTLTGTISWMIPLHINREYTEEPELVLVLRKAGEFFEIKTILPYDDETKDKLTDLSLYSKLW